jgi:phosphatidate phosphatase LPIN
MEEEDNRSAVSSMPGSFEERGQYMPRRDAADLAEAGVSPNGEDGERDPSDDDEEGNELDDSFDDDAIFDDDILAAGEMKNVPF